MRSWTIRRKTPVSRSSAVGVELGIGGGPGLLAQPRQLLVEEGAVDTEDGAPVHLHQPAVAVPGEPVLTAGDERQPPPVGHPDVETVSIMPGIENRAPTAPTPAAARPGLRSAGRRGARGPIAASICSQGQLRGLPPGPATRGTPRS